MLEHGGRLQAAVRATGIQAGEWLDLSTGINPFPYTVPAVPQELWHRLPEDEDGLTRVCKSYYGAAHILPVAGAQAAIQAIPRLFSPCKVGVLNPTYNEHPHAWLKSGHELVDVEASDLTAVADRVDVLVLCNPNNPDGAMFYPSSLLKAHEGLRKRGGTLIVDEAFIDVHATFSVVADTHRDGLVVIRSLGKFFGLAGARVGFVAAQSEFLERLADELGPWTVSAASAFVAMKALQDVEWHSAARARLLGSSEQLVAALKEIDFNVDGVTPFFVWIKHPDAREICERLLQEAVLIRCFDRPSSMRIGLPSTAGQLKRLVAALSKVRDLADAASASGAILGTESCTAPLQLRSITSD